MAVTTFKNIRDNKSGTLLTAITATQTTLTLNTGQGASFPAAPFYISCDFEVMICTAKVADVFTVQRGVDNTIAAIHAAGSLVEMRSVAALWNDLAAAINAIESGNNQFVVDGSVAANAAIALSKLARYPFTNADLASDVPRVNLLTNGGLEIWQRGIGPATAWGTFCADRWQLSQAGTDTLSVTKETTTVDISSSTSAKCVFVLGTGNGTSRIQQPLVTSDWGNVLLNRTVTFSVRVNVATASAVRIGIDDFYAGTSHITRGTVHTGNGTWQTLSVTAVISSGATAVHPIIEFMTSCTAYIDNAMFVLGSVPVDYVPLSPADDFFRAQRYCKAFGVSSSFPGQAIGPTQADVLIPLFPLAGSPTAVTWTGTLTNNFLRTAAQGSAAMVNSAPPATGQGPPFYYEVQPVTSVAASLVAGNATSLILGTGCGLILEWNP